MKVEDTCGYMECGVKEIRGSDAGERGQRVKPNEVTWSKINLSVSVGIKPGVSCVDPDAQMTRQIKGFREIREIVETISRARS